MIFQNHVPESQSVGGLFLYFLLGTVASGGSVLDSSWRWPLGRDLRWGVWHAKLSWHSISYQSAFRFHIHKLRMFKMFCANCYELKIPSCNKVKIKWKVPEITGLNRVAIETMETAEVEQ